VPKHPFQHHCAEALEWLADLSELKVEERQADSLASIAHSLSALVWIQAAQFREIRKIRRLKERQHNNETVRFNSTVTLVSKDGGNPMPAPVVKPTETQDVQCNIAPTNRAGEPTSGPFEWTVNSPALTPQPSSDGKQCLLVTAPGAIDAVAIVTDTVSGNTDTFPVQRTVAPPPDNLTTNFNPSSTAVDKPTP
jgi:hypothetical protein